MPKENENQKSALTTMKSRTSVIVIAAAVCIVMLSLQVLVSYSISSQYATMKTSSTTITTNLLDHDVNTMKHNSGNCVSSQELDKVLSDVNNVYIMSPTKAGGTSAVDFARFCFGSSDTIVMANLEGSKPSWDQRVTELIHKEKVPQVMGGHIFDDIGLMKLATFMDRRTSLIVYMYRNELDRQTSGIKYVINHVLCGGEHTMEKLRSLMKNEMGDKMSDDKFQAMAEGAVSNVDGKCTVDEDFVYLVIESGVREIGQGNNRILTCDLYDSLEESDPNLMFMHFSKMDELQKVVAEKFCPDLLQELPLHSNDHSTEYSSVFIHSKQFDKTFELQEWLQNKASSFALAFGQTTDKYKRLAAPKCNQKTHQIEEETLSCPSQTIRLPNFK